MHDRMSTETHEALPHNLEAERAILGAILIRNEVFNLAAEVIDAEDFYREAHRLVFDRMVDLDERRQAIDLVTLRDDLQRSEELDRVGGAAYIASLADGVPRSTNVEHYAQIVRDHSMLRKVIASADRISAEAWGGGDPSLILDRAEQEIFAIAEGRLRGGFQKVGELTSEAIESIGRLEGSERTVSGVPTGFQDLDELTAGLQRGDLILLAGRPSMGKTALAINMATKIGSGKNPKTVGFFSLEMTKQQLFLRMLTAAAEVDAHRLRTGLLSEKDYEKLANGMEIVSELEVYIDDSATVGVLEMRAKARRLKAEHRLEVLFIDYLQLMSGRGRFEGRQQEVASVSRALKGLAKELDIPVVALSQLSRAPEGRADKRPMLSDLRESGALEQDADVVMFMFREDMYDATAENEGIAEVIIGKQRNGPTGMVKLAFLKQQTRFENLNVDYM